MEQTLQTLNTEQRAVVWAERIAACRSSNLSVRAWCRENQLSEKTYYYWQRRLYHLVVKRQQPAFVEITQNVNLSVAVTVRIGRVETEIYNGADENTIETVLRFLSHVE